MVKADKSFCRFLANITFWNLAICPLDEALIRLTPSSTTLDLYIFHLSHARSLCNTLCEICLLRKILFICEKHVENPFVIIAGSITKNANIAKLLPKCDIVHSYYYYTLSASMVKQHHVLVMKEDKYKPLLVTFADCCLHIPLQIHWQPSGDPGVEPLIRNEFDDDPFPSTILRSLSCPSSFSIYEGKTQLRTLHILKHLKSAANIDNWLMRWAGLSLFLLLKYHASCILFTQSPLLSEHVRLKALIDSYKTFIKLTVLKTIAEAINMLITNSVVTNLISIYHCSILECHQWNEVLEVVASASKSLGASKCMEQLEDKKHVDH
ncbi:hypothetical protein T07_1321 [Trichinella nelsoni]|uniref:Uncharacterized protein n=1 Tax=Trichinella nelsoni TaxID=6336 RepID=A0A0V0SJ36_9BILA|nr:hypothetical protein T07_1321 [Trichinella nelsoni]